MGTTTLVAYLCDLEDGIIKRTLSMLNPQIKTGADILTRLTYSHVSEENRKRLENLLADAIFELAGRFCDPDPDSKDAPVLDKDIQYERIVLVGNPIIMGSIRNYSFDRLAKETVRIPGIGDFVGADALSASYLLEKQRKGGNDIIIDIGTNTEIVLLTDRIKLATSAAAGPAMEGGNISCGMLASKGSISLINTTCGTGPNSDLAIKVISDSEDDSEAYIEPKGICGSGLISLLSTLKDVGAIDASGYLLSKTQALSNNVPGKIAGRIIEGSDEPDALYSCRYFRITDSVYISQEDIRNMQLAFSAIHSGIDVLLRKAGMEPTDFENILLAGAFGSKIRRTDWVNLNILPMFYANRVIEVGNLAGLGAAHILMNPESLQNMYRLKEEISTFGLDNVSFFEELFIENMHF